MIRLSRTPADKGKNRGEPCENKADETDLEIIAELSADARASFREIAKRVGISPTTLISRVRRMEKAGIITGYSAKVDATKLGYEFMAIIEITITKGALLEVQEKIAAFPGIVAVYDVTGLSDSMALAQCKSRQEFSRLVKRILAIPNVERTNTHVILNVVKEQIGGTA